MALYAEALVREALDMFHTSKHILVGIDGSPNSTLALRWAIEHASAASLDVAAVHAFFIPVLAYSASGVIPPEQLDAEHQARLVYDSALESAGGARGTSTSLRVREGYPPDALATAAEAPDVAMVVIGARGHGKLDELFLGSVSHSLTHRCHKPLVIVPPKWTGGDGRVVVGFKEAPESVPALRWAAESARPRGFELEVVAVRPGSDDQRRRPDHSSDPLAEALSHVETEGISVSVQTLEGHAASVLLGRAAGAELLAVGTRGLGRFHEALTGSVTHTCAEHSPVPVAIVRDDPPAHE